MVPKQIFLRCAVVLLLSCLPAVLHAEVCNNGFCFERVGTHFRDGGGVIYVFGISADKPVAELHLSIGSINEIDNPTSWADSFPPPELSPPPAFNSTIDFSSNSMTFDLSFSPSAPLPEGTYEVASLYFPDREHDYGWDASGQFSDGSNFSTSFLTVPEPSTFALLAMLSPLLCCPFRTGRSFRRQRARSRGA